MKASLGSNRAWIVLGLAVCLSWVAGCGASGKPTGTVAGKVTLHGQPLTAGSVLLTNTASGIGASAPLDETGNYQLATPVPTGAYDVAIQPPPAPPPEQISPAKSLPKSPIPDKFLDPKTSGLKATINAGKNTADFAL